MLKFFTYIPQTYNRVNDSAPRFGSAPVSHPDEITTFQELVNQIQQPLSNPEAYLKLPEQEYQQTKDIIRKMIKTIAIQMEDTIPSDKLKSYQNALRPLNVIQETLFSFINKNPLGHLTYDAKRWSEFKLFIFESIGYLLTIKDRRQRDEKRADTATKNTAIAYSTTLPALSQKLEELFNAQGEKTIRIENDPQKKTKWICTKLDQPNTYSIIRLSKTEKGNDITSPYTMTPESFKRSLTRSRLYTIPDYTAIAYFANALGLSK